MAVSFPRSDSTSPASIAEAGFSSSRRGYNPDEVRALLVSVAVELGRLQDRERQLASELSSALASASPKLPIDDDTIAQLLGEETLRVLQTARESSSQIRIRAEENAAAALRSANDEANRLRQDAEVEAARKRHDTGVQVAAELELAKQQGRDMVTEAQAYRQRVLSDLERRTSLARQQINDLFGGRDRLLQVFERARSVAVDIASELHAVEEPEEFVNLAATTGPVPLTVPRSALPDREHPVMYEQDDETDDEPTVALEAAPLVVVAVQPAEVEFVEAAASDEPVSVQAEPDQPAPVAVVEVVADPSPSPQQSDDNVVALFRGRTPINLPQVEPAKSDLKGLFARLRTETPTIEVPAVAPILSSSDATDGRSDPDAVDGYFARRDEALVPLITACGRKLKRVLADEQNGVLDLLRSNESIRKLDALLPSPSSHFAQFADSIADELLEAAVAGAVEVGKHDTKTLRKSLGRASVMASATSVLKDRLIGPLRMRLERCVAEGGGTNDDVTRRVRAVYREWKTQQIDDQLDDLLLGAFGGGLAASIEPGTPVEWIIDPAAKGCPDCEDNSLAGRVAAGGAFPTGHTASPAHPGCRCLVLPVKR